ncbi:MAG: hypothetical protein M3417_07330 [Actinomycetota bacterium]|nr:hypothetical protein [Actinomycetota bacterium]
MPTPRFWLLTLLGYPAAGIALLLAVSAVRAPFGLAALGVLALEARLLAHERTVRRMSPRWRALWVVLGCTMTAAVAALGAGVFFFVLLLEHCADGC